MRMPFATRGGPHTNEMESVCALEAVRMGTCSGTMKKTVTLRHLLCRHVTQAAFDLDRGIGHWTAGLSYR